MITATRSFVLLIFYWNTNTVFVVCSSASSNILKNCKLSQIHKFKLSSYFSKQIVETVKKQQCHQPQSQQISVKFTKFTVIFVFHVIILILFIFPFHLIHFSNFKLGRKDGSCKRYVLVFSQLIRCELRLRTR